METLHRVKFLHWVTLCGVIKYVELFTIEVIEVIMINLAIKCLCSPSSWLISQLSTTEDFLSCQVFEHFRWGHAEIKNSWWTFEKFSYTFLSSTEADQHENLRQAVVRKRWGFGGEGDDKLSEFQVINYSPLFSTISEKNIRSKGDDIMTSSSKYSIIQVLVDWFSLEYVEEIAN